MKRALKKFIKENIKTRVSHKYIFDFETVGFDSILYKETSFHIGNKVTNKKLEKVSETPSNRRY